IYERGSDGDILFSLDTLKKTAVIMRSSGHDVVTLSIDNHFQPHTGAKITMRYLEDGRKGRHSNCNMLAIRGNHRDGTTWKLFYEAPHQGLQPIETLFLKKNTFFGILVGIEKVLA